MSGTEFQQWADSLALWGIPQHILDSAPQSPWIHPVVSFTPTGNLYVDTPSRIRALEVLNNGDSVLDIGCGGGRAAFGLTPPATHVVGVDHQAEMLEVFSSEAAHRGVECKTVLGDWPDVQESTPICDVVTCHHVLYNISALEEFIHALHNHAAKRVVIEIPQRHPLSSLSPMWKKFWNLDRPTEPSCYLALNSIRSLGYDAHLELFTDEFKKRPVTRQDIEFTRIRLCLTLDRDNEIEEFIRNNPVTTRESSTIWWDV